MDLALVRTFLEVAQTGSFVSAADRLYVTQSAVSLRVQRLEQSLGQTLFTRSKAGAELTKAGAAFERYALSMLRTWEEARQQIGLPEGFTESLTLGAQYSLWPRLGFRTIDALRRQRPTLNIRAELGMSDRITRFLIEGMVDAALLYTPQLRPGLSARKLAEEELVMVSSGGAETLEGVQGQYVFVDWGPEFVQAHALHLPGLTNPGLTLSLGALAADFILRRGQAAYLPARHVKRHLDEGTMHLVADAPIFPYPIWLVWRDDVPDEIVAELDAALAAVLRETASDRRSVMAELETISHGIETLGETGE